MSSRFLGDPRRPDPGHLAAGDKALDKAEEHYKAAGLYLLEAKERVRRTPGLTWSAFVLGKCGMSVRRADELIRFADGRTTLERSGRRPRRG